MLAAIVYHRPQQHTGDPSASLFGLHENAGQMRLVSVLGAVLLFEDRQPNDLAVDVGAECHGISQPFSERLIERCGRARSSFPTLDLSLIYPLLDRTSNKNNYRGSTGDVARGRLVF
jgi:hypothetical protein